MRITRLQLRNFRAFRELDMSLEPATLLVGANDAGKSTIVDAISMVLATGYDIYEFLEHQAEGRRVPWEHVVHRGDGSDNADDRVFVSVTFDELSPTERDSWRVILGTGAPLRLGRRWETKESYGTFCVVLDRPQYLQLIDDAGLGGFEDSEEKDAYRRHPPDIEDEVWCPFYWLGDMTATFGTQLLGLHPERDVNAICIPGPESALPSPQAVLRPLVSSIVSRRTSLPGPTDAEDPWDQPNDLGPLLGQLDDAASSAVEAVSDGLNKAMARLSSEETKAQVSRPIRHRSDILRRVIDEVTGALEVSLDSRPIDRAGAGARRAALLAGLELYRDPDLWTPNDHLILMIEEPEVGLHPGAQRRVASALASLPTHGLQTIVVSHSPTFVGAFPATAIRLVRTAPGSKRTRTVVLPEHLREISDVLEIDPSDVLLARRFVVVEGTSDAKAFRAWAGLLDIDPSASGVQLIPSRGESRASTLMQFLEVAYEGASFVVVLDGGKQTEMAANELRSLHGERVEVRRLEHDQIEKYYTRNAVKAWLAVGGMTLDGDQASEIDGILAGGVNKGALQHLTGRYLDREYHVERDGGMIARLMREQDIAPELRTLLFDLFGD